MCPLRYQQLSHRLLTVADPPGFIFPAVGQEPLIERCQILRLGHRHKMVATEIASLSLHAAFLVRLGRRTELRRGTCQ